MCDLTKPKYLELQRLFNLLNDGKTTSCIVDKTTHTLKSIFLSEINKKIYQTNNNDFFANKSDTKDCIKLFTIRATVQSTLVTHQRIPSLKDDAFNTSVLNFDISQ